MERYREAFSKNAIAKQQLDTQVSTVRQYEGAVKLDNGQLETARVQLAYTKIQAPITGRVGLRLVDAGNIVHPNDTNPLVIITQLEPITAVFSVAQDYLPQIQEQVRAGKHLAVDAFDRTQQKKLASGTLQTLDNQIDTSTGTIKLKAIFPNEDIRFSQPICQCAVVDRYAPSGSDGATRRSNGMRRERLYMW